MEKVSVSWLRGSGWLHGHLLGNSSSAHVAQSVEHILGKDEVTGSNPVMGLPLGGDRLAERKDKKTNEFKPRHADQARQKPGKGGRKNKIEKLRSTNG